MQLPSYDMRSNKGIRESGQQWKPCSVSSPLGIQDVGEARAYAPKSRRLENIWVYTAEHEEAEMEDGVAKDVLWRLSGFICVQRPVGYHSSSSRIEICLLQIDVDKFLVIFCLELTTKSSSSI